VRDTDPRPRPATYDAGAGIDKNASLFLFDAIVVNDNRTLMRRQEHVVVDEAGNV
jgi:hypothetical protein